LQRRACKTRAQWPVTDQMRHGPAHLDYHDAEHHRRHQPGKGRNAGGDIAAKLTGNLRTGQRVTQGGEEADDEQRMRGVASYDTDRCTLVPRIEKHDD
nr:hypothetical protein [Tanacetum cinerariifolium]